MLFVKLLVLQGDDAVKMTPDLFFSFHLSRDKIDKSKLLYAIWLWRMPIILSTVDGFTVCLCSGSLQCLKIESRSYKIKMGNNAIDSCSKQH